MHLPVNIIEKVPKAGEAGYFGVKRKFDIHTGIDLYTEEGEPVYSLYHGTIVAIENFTGESAGSPWWNETNSVLVENEHGVILYGELEPNPNIKIGDVIEPDTLLGNVKRVLKKDKGKNPTSMLHIEHYTVGTRESVWWNIGSEQPENLLNPESLFSSLSYFKHVKLQFHPDLMINYYDNYADIDELPVSVDLKKRIICLENSIHDYAHGYTGISGDDLKSDFYMIAEEIKEELGSEWTVEYDI